MATKEYERVCKPAKEQVEPQFLGFYDNYEYGKEDFLQNPNPEEIPWQEDYFV